MGYALDARAYKNHRGEENASFDIDQEPSLEYDDFQTTISIQRPADDSNIH